jgi:hypothetical protein
MFARHSPNGFRPTLDVLEDRCPPTALVVTPIRHSVAEVRHHSHHHGHAIQVHAPARIQRELEVRRELEAQQQAQEVQQELEVEVQRETEGQQDLGTRQGNDTSPGGDTHRGGDTQPGTDAQDGGDTHQEDASQEGQGGGPGRPDT